jgi:hypothetical protein
MGYWKNLNINLGVIKAGKAQKVVFKSLPGIPEITAITPYCGCTAPEKYNKEKGTLTILYSNGSIPNQVQGPQSINKRMDVTYNTGETDVLTIKATKIR